MFTQQQLDTTINSFKNWFRTSIIAPHIQNTRKLVHLNAFKVNPFLPIYLSNYLSGTSDAQEIAKALVYPRVLGTSITTTFGTAMQKFVTEFFSGVAGSTTPGIDIEFIDQIDNRRKYCQLKSGPDSLNYDDVTTIKNHFLSLIRLAHTNHLDVRHEDMLFCITYGEESELNSFIRQLRDQYVVYAGRDFWFHFTGDNSFYDKLINAAGEVAREVNSSQVVQEVITALAHEIEEAGWNRPPEQPQA